MIDTRQLLNKISAFRQRLESMPKLVPESKLRPVLSEKTQPETPDEALETRVRSGSRTQELLESSLRQVLPPNRNQDAIPRLLTARARRILLESRDHLTHIRALADHPLLQGPPSEIAPEIDPLVIYFQETTAILESAIRLSSNMPDLPSVQLRLCDGLEGILGSVRDRLLVLNQSLLQRRDDVEVVDTLALYLTAIESGQTIDASGLIALADRILAEDAASALRFLSVDPSATQAYLGGPTFVAPARFIATNSIVIARVLARLTRNDPEWREHPREPILAALLHDVGMLRIPVEILQSKTSLSDEQRRTIESHPRIGAELIEQNLSELKALIPVIACHHERMDGTGYPEGLPSSKLHPLTRLLSVADAYVSLCSARPYREAQDPRTSLTDTLMMAEHGDLDRVQAQKLLALSFYPIGSVVELSDGSIGAVVANHPGRFQLSTASRPVIALLRDRDGHLLLTPQHLDLMESDRTSVLRTLKRDERRSLLARHYPEWAAS